MYVWFVNIQVKPDSIDAFIEATIDNARNSIEEAGVVRFDVIQQMDDPTRFSLYEIYHTPEDAVKHKETEHFFRWRDTVADMMAVPRSGIKYRNIFPPDDGFAE